MTSEAPERIWALADRRKQWSDTPPEEWSGHPTWHWSEYIRADLHQQALDAAREEGRRKGLEEAARVGPIPCYETRHVMLGDKVRNAIRALIDKPADQVAEAARVSRVFVHRNTDKGDIFAFTTTGTNGDRLASAITRLEGWTVFDHHEYQVTTVEAALCALAQKEGECERR